MVYFNESQMKTQDNRTKLNALMVITLHHRRFWVASPSDQDRKKRLLADPEPTEKRPNSEGEWDEIQPVYKRSSLRKA